MPSIDTVNDLPPRVQYVALAGQTTFDYPFPIFEDSDLVVNVDGEDLSLSNDYTVTGEGDDTGGTVTLVDALAGGEIVTIYRDIVIARDTDVDQNGPWRSAAYNDEQDKIFLILQQLEVNLGRCLRLSTVDQTASPEDFVLPEVSDRAGMYLAFDALGLPIASSGTGADSALRADLASTTSGNDGSRLSGYRHTATGSVARSVHAKLNEIFSVADFGAVADGTDQYAKIKAAMDAAAAAGGGVVYFPFTGEDGYGITETLQPYDNVTMQFQGSFLKLLGDTAFDSAITPVPGARNVTLINPLIDCNSIPAGCGIIARRNNTDMTILGGTVKNAVHDETDKGGRGLNVETGVDPALEGPRNLRVYGLLVKNSYEALSVSGGDAASSQQESNIRIDMIAENCQSAISLFGNTANYPHGPEEMGCHITMTARNCGKATTYARAHGVVNSDRGCNVKIDLQVMNDSTYGAVGSLWRGDASNVIFNAQMTGECSQYLLNFSSYSEADAIDEDVTWTNSGSALSTLDSEFTVKHKGTIADTIGTPIITADFLKNCRFHLVTDVVTTGKPGNANFANKSTCYLWAQNKTSNAIIEGYGPDIDQATFAQAAGLHYNASKQGKKAWVSFAGATGVINRSFNITSVTRTAAGTYDIVLNIKPPSSITSYSVVINAQAASVNNQVEDYTNITNSGCRVVTYNGGVATDKGIVNVEFTW